MLRDTHHTLVIVPGLRGHVEDHWQTRLAAKAPDVVVVPSFGRDKRDLAGRVADLHQVISDAGAPVTIVAHSAGVLTTVHWARQHDLPVRGALLATPPDLARPLPAAVPHPGPARGVRLAARAASPAAVPQHRRGQHQRRARRLRERAQPRARTGAAGSSTSGRSATSTLPRASATGPEPRPCSTS